MTQEVVKTVSTGMIINTVKSVLYYSFASANNVAEMTHNFSLVGKVMSEEYVSSAMHDVEVTRIKNAKLLAELSV